MTDERELGRFRGEALRRTGTRDLVDLARSTSLQGLEPDLAAVTRLRLGLDRRPPRPRTRAEVAEELGLGGARVDAMVAALEGDALDALGPRSAVEG